MVTVPATNFSGVAAWRWPSFVLSEAAQVREAAAAIAPG
jgi:hypothetical protein